MKRKIAIAPSLLACDFYEIGKQLQQIEEGGAEYLHLDVMDGLFVPNISFGQPLIRSLRSRTGLHFDVHLMIENPMRYIDDFAAAGADTITIHLEAAGDCSRTLSYIKSKGVRAAVSIKPGTEPETLFGLLEQCDMALVMTVEPGFGGQKFMPDMLRKLERLRNYVAKNGLSTLLEVDGGVDCGNAASCVRAGADILVAGSSVFGAADVCAAASRLLACAREGLREDLSDS